MKQYGYTPNPHRRSSELPVDNMDLRLQNLLLNTEALEIQDTEEHDEVAADKREQKDKVIPGEIGVSVPALSPTMAMMAYEVPAQTDKGRAAYISALSSESSLPIGTEDHIVDRKI